MHEINERTKHLLKRKIEEVINKGDISPNEMECIEEAYETLAHIATIEAMEDYGSDESYRRGGRSMTQRYDYWYPDDMAMRRGRGADGRYISRDSYYTNDVGGRSNHSVNDRIIANLEHELNNSTSDYEKQKIMDEIRRIREMKD